MNTWITSDTHYSHKNIVRGVSRWEGGRGTRDIDTLQEMNEKLVENINNCAKENDTLYHLGDWSFGGVEMIPEFRNKLICKNIHLLLGNHDNHIAANKNDTAKLFSSVAHYREVKIAGQQIIMSHYPMTSWNYKFQGGYMLSGHCHGNLPKELYLGKSMDVGIDTHSEFRPYHIDEINDIMQKRTVDFSDKITNR